MLAFTLAQGFYLAKYIEDEPAAPEGAAKGSEGS
jgi:hypothetical protein